MNRTLPIRVAAAVAVSACGPRLSHLSSSKLEVLPYSDYQPVETIQVRVRLDYDVERSGCLLLSGNARATVNGEVVTDLGRGGELPFDPLYSVLPRCRRPFFDFPWPTAEVPEITVAIEDGGEVVSEKFLSLGSLPTLTVTPPADGHIRLGSTIGLSYSPTTDDYTKQHWWFSSAPRQDGTRMEVNVALDDFVDGNGAFVIPTNVPPGPATIEAIGKRVLAVTDCQGVDTCTAEYQMQWPPSAHPSSPLRSFRVALDVEP